MDELIKKLASINLAIEDAKLRYKNKEFIDEDIGLTEFFDEDDLERYIASYNYEKTEFIKDNIEKFKVILEYNIVTEDKELIRKIISLIDCIPSDFHKCVGCPCLENDYPSCYKCIYYENCVSGNRAYPNECNEGDCHRTFKWMNDHEKIIRKAEALNKKKFKNT